MSLINFDSPIIKNYNGALPRLLTMAVTDSLATTAGSGYLNGLKDVHGNFILSQVNGVNINPQENGGAGMVVNTHDFFFISCSDGQGMFYPSFSGVVVTLTKAV